MTLFFQKALCYTGGCSIGQRQEDNILLDSPPRAGRYPPYLPAFILSSANCDHTSKRCPSGSEK